MSCKFSQNKIHKQNRYIYNLPINLFHKQQNTLIHNIVILLCLEEGAFLKSFHPTNLKNSSTYNFWSYWNYHTIQITTKFFNSQLLRSFRLPYPLNKILTHSQLSQLLKSSLPTNILRILTFTTFEALTFIIFHWKVITINPKVKQVSILQHYNWHYKTNAINSGSNSDHKGNSYYSWNLFPGSHTCSHYQELKVYF